MNWRDGWRRTDGQQGQRAGPERAWRSVAPVQEECRSQCRSQCRSVGQRRPLRPSCFLPFLPSIRLPACMQMPKAGRQVGVAGIVELSAGRLQSDEPMPSCLVQMYRRRTRSSVQCMCTSYYQVQVGTKGYPSCVRYHSWLSRHLRL